jgi:hypothetical protein
LLQELKAVAQAGAIEDQNIVALSALNSDDLGTQLFLDRGELGTGFRHEASVPIQGAFFPDIDVAYSEDDEKNSHLHETKDTKLAKINGPRIEKNNF